MLSVTRAGWVIALACGCIARPCEAAWSFITSSDDGLMTFYGDHKSIEPHKGALRVRLLFDYAQLQQDPDTLIEHRSTVEIASIDCHDRRLAAIEATSYAKNMGRGAAVVVNERVPDPSLHYVKATPGTVDDKVVTFVCEFAVDRVPTSETAMSALVARTGEGRDVTRRIVADVGTFEQAAACAEIREA